jgi:hypothetical protein
MKKIAMLLGLVVMVAAGTASAQTSVSVQLGFGAPRPYIAGDVFIGQSFVRPEYRPYYYYYPNRYPYYFDEPLPLWYGRPQRVIIYQRDHRFYRRDFDRERDWRQAWSRNHGGHEWDRDRDRNDRDWGQNRDDRGREHGRNRDRDRNRDWRHGNRDNDRER